MTLLDGVRAQPSEFEAMSNFPQLISVKELRTFSVIINFYHRFFPASADILTPIYQAMSFKENHFFWTNSLNKRNKVL